MNATASPGPEPLRCAVIGSGYMGRLHASKFAASPDWKLVAVVDADPATAQAVAAECGTRSLSDHRELLGQVDAVSIAVPTSLHFGVARDFLEASTHVLLEKPITVTVAEADQLIALAAAQGLVLQVGHLERFNPALLALDVGRGQPRFIEATRLAPFSPRANDVSVVLDLMIHDIDLILDLVNADVERVDAVGTPVLTSDIDIANARLAFSNGCVANVTASRVSLKVERKLRMFLPDSYLSIDLRNRVASRHSRGQGEMAPGIPMIESEEHSFESGDALAAQAEHFARCIREGREPFASGVSGRRALAVAARIGELLERC
ncbi:MAG: Gfo/Idh/MocA family oxidoreductase [Chromatiales bacterium]|nr:Gfo/Idh/MocA family oxidoreductase [Chromatiales bacterium]